MLDRLDQFEVSYLFFFLHTFLLFILVCLCVHQLYAEAIQTRFGPRTAQFFDAALQHVNTAVMSADMDVSSVGA